MIISVIFLLGYTLLVYISIDTASRAVAINPNHFCDQARPIQRGDRGKGESWLPVSCAQKALRWEIVGLGGLALIAALLLSLLLSHGLSVPIRELVTGTEEIRQGNFAVTVPIRSQDELGQLAASFNEMASQRPWIVSGPTPGVSNR